MNVSNLDNFLRELYELLHGDFHINRCNYTYQGNNGAHSCWREVWDNKKCIWHAETDNKPIEALTEARSECRERLDGAILEGTIINEEINFDNCTLIDSDLRHADLSHTSLMYANLTNSKLIGANLTHADLYNADLSESDIQGSILNYANLWNAKLINVNAYGAVFQNTRINSNTDFGKYCSYDPREEPELVFTYAERLDLDAAHKRQEIETDLLGAYYLATGEAPLAQFGYSENIPPTEVLN